MAAQLIHLDPRRPGTLGNPNLGGQGAAELQRLRMEMDTLLRSNLMTGLDEVREQLANNIKIQSQLARACADLEEWRRWEARRACPSAWGWLGCGRLLQLGAGCCAPALEPVHGGQRPCIQVLQWIISTSWMMPWYAPPARLTT